jgi:hypothetical protein
VRKTESRLRRAAVVLEANGRIVSERPPPGPDGKPVPVKYSLRFMGDQPTPYFESMQAVSSSACHHCLEGLKCIQRTCTYAHAHAFIYIYIYTRTLTCAAPHTHTCAQCTPARAAPHTRPHAHSHTSTHAHTHTRTCALTVPCHSLPTHAGETFVELGMQTVAYAAIAFLDAELSDVPAAIPVQQSMSVSPAGTFPAGVPTAPSNPHPPPSGKDTAPWGAAQPAPLPHSMESESPASPKHAEAALQVPVPPPVSGGAPGYYVAPGAGWAAQHAPAPYAPGPAPGPAVAPLHATYNPLMVHAGPPSVPAGPVMTFSPAPPAPWTPVGAPATSPSSHAPFLGTGSSGAAPTSWFGPAYASMCAMVATGDRAAILTGLQV